MSCRSTATGHRIDLKLGWAAHKSSLLWNVRFGPRSGPSRLSPIDSGVVLDFSPCDNEDMIRGDWTQDWATLTRPTQPFQCSRIRWDRTWSIEEHHGQHNDYSPPGWCHPPGLCARALSPCHRAGRANLCCLLFCQYYIVLNTRKKKEKKKLIFRRSDKAKKWNGNENTYIILDRIFDGRKEQDNT
jgi:hypothetical protein